MEPHWDGTNGKALIQSGKKGRRPFSPGRRLVADHPLIQLAAKSKDGRALAAGYCMNGEAAVVPALSGTLVAVEVICNSFPAVESRGVRLHGPSPS
jgi:hypothetical protein